MGIRSFAPLALAAASASCSALGLGDSVGGLTDWVPSTPEKPAPLPVNEDIAQVLFEHDLTSDRMEIGDYHDSNLVGAWGLSFDPDGPAWVSKSGAGLASSYNAKGGLLLTLVIPQPPEQRAPSRPTGQVYNGDTGSFAGDRFIFVTADGVIAGWQPTFEGAAKLRVFDGDRHAIYKGVTLARAGRDLRLYAADFANARVDVFGKDYERISLAEGGFVDPDLPVNYAPFNVYSVNDLILVAYAEQQLPEKATDASGPGKGFIDLFDTAGHLLTRLASHGTLNSPWGMAMAPAGYGQIPGRLLVGNAGDGRIGVYQMSLGAFQLHAEFEGFIGTSQGAPVAIDGLKAIGFPAPPGAGAFNPRDLYFTAGPTQGKDGVLGVLSLSP